jgi:hypothetical protein
MTALFALYMRLTTPRRQSWYAIPLRLIVGYGFIEHGFAKLARGPDSFTAILHALGVPVPALFAWATVAVGRLCGAHWRFYSDGKYSNDHRAACGDLYGTFSERVQFYQATICGCGRRTFRAAGL